jgi:hypothetical protein
VVDIADPGASEATAGKKPSSGVAPSFGRGAKVCIHLARFDIRRIRLVQRYSRLCEGCEAKAASSGIVIAYAFRHS